MTYALDPTRPLRDELQRVSVEPIDAAILRLRKREDTFGADVHEARKSIKESKAVLRLVRGQLGGKPYRRQRERLRPAARTLATVRDAEVMRATLLSVDDARTMYAPLHDELDRRHRSVRARTARPDVIEPVIDALTAAREAASQWSLGEGRWKPMADGFLATYRQARQRMSRVADLVDSDPTKVPASTDAATHAWRSRAKDHWYHLRLLSPAWPAPIEAMAEQAHHVSELLGAHQDLAVLDAAVANMDGVLDAAATESVRGELQDRRARLRTQALVIGVILYAAKPTEAAAYFGSVWKAAGRRSAS